MDNAEVVQQEIDQVVIPATPLLLKTLVDLASNARSKRTRASAGRNLRFLISELFREAEHPETFRGSWAKRALEENADRCKAYLQACIDQKAQTKRRSGGKQNRKTAR